MEGLIKKKNKKEEKIDVSRNNMGAQNLFVVKLLLIINFKKNILKRNYSTPQNISCVLFILMHFLYSCD